MLRKLRMARDLLDMAILTKHEARDTKERLARLTAGADEGLEVADSIGNAIRGEFSVVDSWTLGLKAYNWAPKIDPSLRGKLPWSWRED